MNSRRTQRLALPALLLTMAVGAAPSLAEQPTRGEEIVKYRKSVYQVIRWNFAPMGAMAQDKVPYDATEFAMRAERVAALAPMLAESYTGETRGTADSKAKPEIWSNRADFDAKLKDLLDRSATLATVAKAGDATRSKAAFVDTANACKACHDKYRAD
jgi:cytochrome c556